MSGTYHLTNSFTMKNLGSLEYADISLKPLTILCGKNNTGKTWLMYSIYGFLKNDLDNLNGINNIIDNLKENGTFYFNLSEWVEKNYKSFIGSIERINKNNLMNLFNSSYELFEDTSFSWNVDLNTLQDNIFKSEFKVNLILGSKEDTFFLASKSRGSEVELMLSNNLPNNLIGRAISSIIYKSCLGICKTNAKNVFLIPAERNGLHLFYKELSNRRTALLHHASREQLDLKLLLRDVLGSKYAKPIADYIDWLNELPDLKKNKEKKRKDDPLHIIAEEIKKIIGGKYEINNDGNIEFIPKKHRGKPSPPKLDLHLSSSTVKSLFGIWFYLEYQAQVSDTIMLDEPELNLHPSNQRVIARIVTKLVNAGINVILSTHSDYFVREINSLIMLSDVQGDQSTKSLLMAKYSISDDCVLNKDKIGAYLFKNNIVEPMEITNEGIIATTFDEEINLLNESSDDIYYSYIEPIYTDFKTTS